MKNRTVMKALFVLKMTGAFDAIVKHAYTHGFVNGLEQSKVPLNGANVMDVIEENLKDYKEQLERDMAGK